MLVGLGCFFWMRLAYLRRRWRWTACACAWHHGHVPITKPTLASNCSARSSMCRRWRRRARVLLNENYLHNFAGGGRDDIRFWMLAFPQLLVSHHFHLRPLLRAIWYKKGKGRRAKRAA